MPTTTKTKNEMDTQIQLSHETMATAKTAHYQNQNHRHHPRPPSGPVVEGTKSNNQNHLEEEKKKKTKSTNTMMSSSSIMKQKQQPKPKSYHSFQQRVKSANKVSICGTTSSKVGRMSMSEILLESKYQVPIFQRRYCWTTKQWQTFIEDAIFTRAKSNNGQHSLGRLTCTRTYTNNISNNGKKDITGKEEEGEQRSYILDGQQRFTTTTILLAAIRDVWQEEQQQQNQHQQHNDDNDGYFDDISKVINNLIFTDLKQLEEWMKNSSIKLEEGIELSFARLIPTFCDRWSYYAAILPSLPPSKNKGGEDEQQQQQQQAVRKGSCWDRPLQAKQYFMKKLRQQQKQQQPHHPRQRQQDYLKNLLQGVLDGFNMLYFPIDLHNDRSDGTEDLMVIYERLALRDMMFCKPSRGELESKSMDGPDMVRNLLLGSFTTQTKAIEFYKTYWLPMEQMTITPTDDDEEEVEEDEDEDEELSYDTSSEGKTIGQVLEAFLDFQRKEADFLANSTNPGSRLPIVGGKLYQDFQAWFATNLPSSTTETTTTEEKVNLVGKQLLEFTRSYLMKQ